MKSQHVPGLIASLVKEGWSRPQATSLAWVEYFEQKAVEVEYKYQGRVMAAFAMDCVCATCNVSHVFHAHGSVRDFIYQHKGHETKTINRSKRG